MPENYSGENVEENFTKQNLRDYLKDYKKAEAYRILEGGVREKEEEEPKEADLEDANDLSEEECHLEYDRREKKKSCGEEKRHYEPDEMYKDVYEMQKECPDEDESAEERYILSVLCLKYTH